MSIALSTHQLTDAEARESALNAQQSFIIQAPAGSGKTELLIQRFLVLLTTVDDSSKVLAITFTKKAAGEMRYRIHKALERALDDNMPNKPHEQLTWQLARNVYQHAEKLGWTKRHIANQLSIMTIDACCQKLLSMSQPPYQLYAQCNLCLYPKPLYQATITQFIQDYCLHENARFYSDFQALMHIQHHDYQRVALLLESALMNREKWLSLTVSTRHQDWLQTFTTTVSHCQANHIKQLLALFPDQEQDTLNHIFKDLAALNHEIDMASPMDDLSAKPIAQWTLHEWTVLAKICLTQTASVRSRLSQQQGIANQSQRKGLQADAQSHYGALVDTLTTLLQNKWAKTDLAEQLMACHIQPYFHDPEQEWESLKPVFAMLPALAAYLQMQMNQQQTTDFAGINLQLLSALLDEQHSETLVLQTYQSYQHVLIDEFQDTSVSQFDILERAFAAWKGEQQRSITVVGDPMQSIYRFRQAEVKLFRQVQTQGFAGLTLTNLFLSRNYRSSHHLVQQLNQCFHAFMTPAYNRFTPAEAVQENADSGIHWHQCSSAQAQNQQLCILLQQLMHTHPKQSKCLLVRSRSQLRTLLPTLKQANIPFNGVGIHAFSQCQAVLDCYHLLCLPLDLYDRKSWVALLLSPAIAMPLADIHLLCNDKKAALWPQLKHCKPMLSPQGQAIIQRIYQPLQTYLQAHGCRHALDNAKQCWQAIGQPYCLSQDDRHQCEQFFAMVSALEDTGQAIDQASLQQVLMNYPDSSEQCQEGALQIMTIHKSKGLEFDIVLMPHLEKTTPIADKPVLDWTHIQHQQQWHLLMHTHPRHKSKASAVHAFLRHQDKCAQLAETERLYYVAFTRAKSQLHLFNSEKSQYAERSPMKNLAPILKTCLTQKQQMHYTANVDTTDTHQIVHTRTILPPAWQHPHTNDQHKQIHATIAAQSTDPRTPTETHQQNTTTHTNVHHIRQLIAETLKPTEINEKHWGICIHAYLEQALKQVQAEQVLHENKWTQITQAHGINRDTHSHHIQIIYQHLIHMHTDPQFQWLHAHMQNQFLEKTWIHHEQQYRADCVAIDHQKQHCWIIDIKTQGIAHLLQGQTLEKPISIPESYWQQLSRYADCLQSIYPQYQIETGLYFPLHGAWYPDTGMTAM